MIHQFHGRQDGFRLEVLTLESDQVQRMGSSLVSYVNVGKTPNPSEAASLRL